MKRTYQNPDISIEILSEQEILTDVLSVSATGKLSDGVVYSWGDLTEG